MFKSQSLNRLSIVCLLIAIPSYISIGICAVLVGNPNTRPLILELENYFFGAIAIIAAWTSIYAIRQQLLQQSEIIKHTQKKKELACRATLIPVVIDLESISDRYFRHYWDPDNEEKPGPEDVWKNVERLSTLIEYLEPAGMSHLTNLVASFQVLVSRSENFTDTPIAYSIGSNGLLPRNIKTTSLPESGQADWLIMQVELQKLLSTFRDPVSDIRKHRIKEDEIWAALRFSCLDPCSVKSEKLKNQLSRRSQDGYIELGISWLK